MLLNANTHSLSSICTYLKTCLDLNAHTHPHTHNGDVMFVIVFLLYGLKIVVPVLRGKVSHRLLWETFPLNLNQPTTDNQACQIQASTSTSLNQEMQVTSLRSGRFNRFKAYFEIIIWHNDVFFLDCIKVALDHQWESAHIGLVSEAQYKRNQE